MDGDSRMDPGEPGAMPLTALEDHGAFITRHIGLRRDTQEAMLREIGFASQDALIDAIVPASIRLADRLPLAHPLSETEALARLRALAAKNRVLKSMIGQGYYGTHTPGVILRNLLENPAWYTAYTPYQPEISQGRLEALLNFQTMVCDLTGMAIANASMLDEATAAAEAMTLCERVGASKSRRFFIADDTFPQTIDVVRTRAKPLDIEIVVGPAGDASAADAFGILLQYPGADGEIRDHRALVEAAHTKGALVVVATDLLALTLLVPPGEWGADVVVGSSQRFGVPMGFGGPHAAFMATRDAFKRSLPGRLVGVTIDGTPILPPHKGASAPRTRRSPKTAWRGTEGFTHVNVLGMNRRSRRTGEAETGSWPCGQSQKCCTAKGRLLDTRCDTEVPLATHSPAHRNRRGPYRSASAPHPSTHQRDIPSWDEPASLNGRGRGNE